ncbi:putative mitochondrial protein AtMg01110 [Curcuma longa]|uniref:putative mitochondrial protein AtMg01110 n=1 Tax=Curcuma longa TaxID=136217 RepID=UPI003D9F6E0D
MPWLRATKIVKGIKWKPTWKSVPNDDRRMKAFPGAIGNIFSSFKYEITAFANFILNLRMYSPFGVRKGQAGSLWHEGVLRPFDYDANHNLLTEDLHKFKRYEHKLFEPYLEKDGHLHLATGRITSTLPGAGKRRLFVIGNYIIQRLLYPIHSWAMDVLSRLPCDGTFEQGKPIHRLSRYRPENVSSFDLSSATDRWPVAYITRLMSLIFGNKAGECIVLGVLSNNVFTAGPPLLPKKRGNCLLYFKTGQPLGYYSSWALFSLSHHVLVWMAARMEYPWARTPFKRYALLGDDIVIADKRVAERYRKMVDMLGVSISESKSIDSPIGALEFAKQFWMYRVQVNLTPVSAPAVLASNTFLGLVQLADKYSLTKFTLIRLAGAGFRVRSRILSSSITRRWRRLLVIADKSLSYQRLPLDLWFGRGLPLNPYLKGVIVEKCQN